MKFSELLESYLQERDRQNSDYFDDKFVGMRGASRNRMEEYAKQMDELIRKVEDERTNSTTC